jgi:hypothetical protein
MVKVKNKIRSLAPFLWGFFYLAMIDIAVNIIFPYPKDPRDIAPSTLQQYFEFGRSVEGKYARMTRKTNDESAPIVSSGWLENQEDHFITKDRDYSDKPIVTVYGMSHAFYLADDMAKIDETLIIRAFCAPAAVPSWSLAAYSLDKKRQHSDAVILAVLTSGVPLILSTSGSTASFDLGYPYTYPRYFLRNDMLEHISPPFISVEGYREYFFDSEKWKEYLSWMKENDKFYNGLLFRKTIIDNSSVFRVLRRAYASAAKRKKVSAVYDDAKGFNENSDEVRILKAIVIEFAKTARRDRSLPIIYLVNNLNTSNHLFRLLESTLSSYRIPFLSSHLICPPNDPRNYQPDHHFIPSLNIKLATAMTKIIHNNLNK